MSRHTTNTNGGILEILCSTPLYQQVGVKHETNSIPAFFLFTVAFGILVYVFEAWLDRRQLANYNRGGKCPDFISLEKFTSSIIYGREKLR